MHLRYNPNWETYCVMSPASLTDLTSVARADDKSVPMAQLIDYVWMQSEASLKNSAQVWDELVRIEKGNLSDAALLSKASDFRQDYVANHQSDTDVEPVDVRSKWLQWKGRNA